MKNITALHRSSWASRPLCTRYRAIVLTMQDVAFGTTDTICANTVCWALGGFDVDQFEILGYWDQSFLGPLTWSAISSDLHGRGVEHANVALAANDQGAYHWLGKFAAEGTALPHPDSSSAVLNLAPRIERYFAHSVEAALRVRKALARAARRQNIAEPKLSASAFLDRELQRLDRQLWPYPRDDRPKSPRDRERSAAAHTA